MKIWIILGILFLAACASEEIITENEIIKETINQNNEKALEPVPELPKVEETPLEQCGSDGPYPCFDHQETLDEFNYCEVDEDCVFSSRGSCSCDYPWKADRAVNKDEIENYKKDREEFCMEVDILCDDVHAPVYNPIFDTKCDEGMCRVIVTGVTE